MSKITILTAIILTLMIVPTSIYAIQNPKNSSVKPPEEIALTYIRISPTFSFDGIISTLKIENISINKSYPPQYVVTIDIVCLHGGYGDRTGKIVTEALTPHTAVVTVIDGKVSNAIIDGAWDEVAQKTVTDQAKTVVETIALNWLINAPTFKFDGIVGSAKVVNSFLAMTFAAPSFWGVTLEFDSLHAGYGDRTGQMLAQVITHHVVTIHVTEGTVNLAQIDDQWNELKQIPIEYTFTAEMAEQSSLAWLYGCPTFKFDGITETVKVKEIMTLRMMNAWDITIDFTCGYPGYGDRTGNTMLGHSQNHTIKITVIKGQVTRAIIDEKWDEINQVMLDSSLPILSPDEARDIAVKYLIVKLGLDSKLPEVWMIEDLGPQLLGVEKTRYTGGEWVVTVEYAVVWKPTYTVTVENGSSSLTIKVDQNGEVTSDEAKPDMPSLIYTPDIARKLCLDYLREKHPEVAGQIPIEWTEKNIVPEGIVGLTKIQYTSGDWTITVSAPVVWKPTHKVSIQYIGSGTPLTWDGIVPQGGPVSEISFSK